MYKIEIQGCLSLLLITAVIFFIIVKLWWLTAGIAAAGIIYYYSKLIYYNIVNKKNEAEMSYEPKNGEVFKICPYCNAKAKVSAVSCPKCKSPLN